MARPLDHHDEHQHQQRQRTGSIIPILEDSILVGRDIPPALLGKVHWIEWTLFCDELDEALGPLRHYKVLHSTCTTSTPQPRQRRNSHASYFLAGITRRKSSSIIKVKTKALKHLQRACDKQAKKLQHAVKEFVLYCPFNNSNNNNNNNSNSMNIANWHIQIIAQDLVGMAQEDDVYWNNMDIPSSISVPSSSSSFSVADCTTANTTNTFSTTTTNTTQATQTTTTQATQTTTTNNNFFPFQELPRPQRPPPLQFPSSSPAAAAAAVAMPPSTKRKRRLFGSGRKSWFSLPLQRQRQLQRRNYHRSSSLSSLPSRTSSLSSFANNLHRNSNSAPPHHNTTNRANQNETTFPNHHHHHHHHLLKQPTAMMTNPFVDDPQDSVAMSRDALLELDRVLERQWMSAPSLFVRCSRHEEDEDDDDVFIVPIPPPTTIRRAATTTTR